eukprot:4144669-Pleurochrysis_carterae.AAC.6
MPAHASRREQLLAANDQTARQLHLSRPPPAKLPNGRRRMRKRRGAPPGRAQSEAATATPASSAPRNVSAETVQPAPDLN